MKKFLSLLKTYCNMYFGISSTKYQYTREKKSLWKPLLVMAGVVIGIGSLIFLYCLMILQIFRGGQAIGHPEIVLAVAFLLCQLLSLVFGIFYIMSVFYFSNDMDLLVPLPIRPGEVMGVKFITVLLSEYPVVLSLLLPACILYGTTPGIGLFYWLKGIILIGLAPIPPLVLASIFVILLVRIVNIRRNKDLLMIIGSLLGAFLGMGISLTAQSIPDGKEAEYMEKLVQSSTALVESIGSRFPPSIWATLGLSRPGLPGWTYFLLFVGFSLILLAVLWWLGDRFFYKGYLSGQETKRKGKALSRQGMEKSVGTMSSPVSALFRREWKLFLRTPIYVMNSLVGVIVLPLALILPFLTQPEDFKKLLAEVQGPQYGFVTALVVLGIVLLGSSMNMISCTSVSREGHMFWISRMIPVSPKSQVLAKLLQSSVFSSVCQIVIAIPLSLLLHISPVRLLVILVLGTLVNILMNVLGLIIDLLRPKLEWNDPQEAIKQNLNVLFSMLLSWMVVVLFALAAIALIQNGIPEAWVYLGLGLLTLFLTAPGLYGLFALAGHRYQFLEA